MADVASRTGAGELFDLGQWRRHGFAISRTPWLADCAASLRAEYARLALGLDDLDRPPVRYDAEASGLDHLEVLSHVHWASAPVEGIARSPRFGALAAELLDCRRVRLWGTSFFCKEPGQQARNHVAWHRDRRFWQCLSAPRLLTFWIALHPVSAANGSLEFAVRDRSAGEIGPDDSDLEGCNTMPVEGPAGTVSVHHCLTGHRSGPNRMGDTRLSLTLHYMDADLHYVPGTPSDNHINVALIAGRNGNRPDDAYFPVVYADE